MQHQAGEGPGAEDGVFEEGVIAGASLSSLAKEIGRFGIAALQLSFAVGIEAEVMIEE